MTSANMYRRATKPFILDKRWLAIGLLVSLLLHSLLFFLLSTAKPGPRSAVLQEEPPPPARFNLKRVEVDPRSFESPVTPTKLDDPARPLESKPIPIPDEQQDFSGERANEIRVSPAPASGPEATKFQAKAPPSIDLAALALQSSNSQPPEATAKLDDRLADEARPATTGRQLQPAAQDSSTRSDLPALPAGARLEMNNERPGYSAGGPAPGSLDDVLASTSASKGSDLADLAREATRTSGPPSGYSDLDDLLGGTGLKGSEGPILMPTDLLFEYDSAQLRPGAITSIQKLGTLIRKNPQASFRIEGHSDSFGSDAYNMDLSLRRADSVRSWLIANMGIPGDRIATKGFGKTRLLAPANGTVEAQGLNRRVEIVISTR